MRTKWLRKGILGLLLAVMLAAAAGAAEEVHQHPLPGSDKTVVWNVIPNELPETTLESGNYYLTVGNPTRSNPYLTEIGGNVFICLNGCPMDAVEKLMSVNWESTVTIFDCSEDQYGGVWCLSEEHYALVIEDSNDEAKAPGTLRLYDCVVYGELGIESFGTFEAAHVRARMGKQFLYARGNQAKITDSKIDSDETAILARDDSLELLNTVVTAKKYAISGYNSKIAIYGGTISGESADIILDGSTLQDGSKLQLHGRIDGLDRIDVKMGSTICANAGGEQPFETDAPVQLHVYDTGEAWNGKVIVTDAEAGQFELANSTDKIFLTYDAESKSYIYHVLPKDIGSGMISGTSLKWVLDAYGTLTISGDGAIPDATKVSMPWAANSVRVKSVVIGDGCTGVGERAFWRYQSLESVRIENRTELTLGAYAFASCPVLKQIDFAGDGTVVPGDCVFEFCTALERVHLPATVRMNGEYRGAGSGYRMFGACKKLSEATAECAYIGPFMFESCPSSLRLTFTDPDVAFYFLENESGHPINNYDSGATVVGHTCSAVQKLANTSWNNICLVFEPIEDDRGVHREVVVDAAIAPTCSSTGKTAGKHCVHCNAIVEPQIAVPAKGHTWVAASCNVAKHCAECGLTEGECLPVSVADGTVSYVAYADVKDLPSEGAMLCIARYDGGRLTACHIFLLGEQNLSGSCSLGGSGTEYRLFLLMPDYRPLAARRVVQEME